MQLKLVTPMYMTYTICTTLFKIKDPIMIEILIKEASIVVVFVYMGVERQA